MQQCLEKATKLCVKIYVIACMCIMEIVTYILVFYFFLNVIVHYRIFNFATSSTKNATKKYFTHTHIDHSKEH